MLLVHGEAQIGPLQHLDNASTYDHFQSEHSQTYVSVPQGQ